MKYKGITIHKNKTCDTWYTRFRRNGKQYYVSARTQKECYNILKQKYNNLQPEQNSNDITLNEWYHKWLELYKTGKVKNTTLITYNTAMKHIPEEILNKKITEITLTQLITLLNNCNAERVRQNLYDLLNMLFKKAVDNDIIKINLIERIDKPKHTKLHGIALNNKQQEDIIKAHAKINNAEILIIAMYQGLRRGEALGLTWNNVDFNNNTLSITKSWNQYNEFDTTKNTQSVRTMPLFEETKKLLLNHKNKNPNERIFNITKQQLENIIENVKKETKIDVLQFKDMRSTFITRCKELNIPTHIIQAWVGHKIGSSVTNTVYTKFNNDSENKYINILNNSKFYSNSTRLK